MLIKISEKNDGRSNLALLIWCSGMLLVTIAFVRLVRASDCDDGATGSVLVVSRGGSGTRAKVGWLSCDSSTSPPKVFLTETLTTVESYNFEDDGEFGTTQDVGNATITVTSTSHLINV